ncbi:hypothetical protein COCCADRAFT_92445, partial [Bipolaris zeicola 26-R-13]
DQILFLPWTQSPKSFHDQKWYPNSPAPVSPGKIIQSSNLLQLRRCLIPRTQGAG